MMYLCIATFIILHLSIAFETDYLTSKCNGGKTLTDSFRLESSTGLEYNNNMDCTFTLTAASDEKILVLFRRFELENQENGICLDYINFHDGPDTNSASLNVDPLCSNTPPDNMTSSSNVLTLHFVTDSNAVLRGFELLFVVHKDAPCDVSLFSCSNAICVRSSTRCDGFDHCGDNSDEADCSVTAVLETQSYTGLIIGLVVAFVVLCPVVIVGGVYLYNWRKMKKLIKEFRALPDIPIKEPQPSYPVTEKYARKEYKLRMDRDKSQKARPRLEIDPMASTSFSGFSTSSEGPV